MTELKRKIWKTGTSYVITIPAYLIKNKIIDPTKELTIQIK